jgi:hypothetical protein
MNAECKKAIDHLLQSSNIIKQEFHFLNRIKNYMYLTLQEEHKLSIIHYSVTGFYFNVTIDSKRSKANHFAKKRILKIKKQNILNQLN